ncbi:unnamed protein product [Notodromas monacha]|uniref:Uncharacterized protein n=1 Tax=Notodromas monacha TaxID=399045 RepID=A0A7R9BQA2_9CRUS|nr:unnamed protein product [Notodromas monacha]CAG0919663.1 unnamed protein product [Notodromas monacha]
MKHLKQDCEKRVIVVGVETEEDAWLLGAYLEPGDIIQVFHDEVDALSEDLVEYTSGKLRVKYLKWHRNDLEIYGSSRSTSIVENIVLKVPSTFMVEKISWTEDFVDGFLNRERVQGRGTVVIVANEALTLVCCVQPKSVRIIYQSDILIGSVMEKLIEMLGEKKPAEIIIAGSQRQRAAESFKCVCEHCSSEQLPVMLHFNPMSHPEALAMCKIVFLHSLRDSVCYDKLREHTDLRLSETAALIRDSTKLFFEFTISYMKNNIMVLDADRFDFALRLGSRICLAFDPQIAAEVFLDFIPRVDSNDKLMLVLTMLVQLFHQQRLSESFAKSACCALLEVIASFGEISEERLVPQFLRLGFTLIGTTASFHAFCVLTEAENSWSTAILESVRNKEMDKYYVLVSRRLVGDAVSQASVLCYDYLANSEISVSKPGLGRLVHSTLVHDLVPKVYSHAFLAHVFIAMVQHLLEIPKSGEERRRSENVGYGFLLLEASVNMFDEEALDESYVEATGVVENFSKLLSIATFASDPDVRRSAVRIFESLSAKFDVNGKMRVLARLTKRETQTGIREYLIRETKNCFLSGNVSGLKVFRQVLLNIFDFPNGSSVLDNEAWLLAACSFLRLLIAERFRKTFDISSVIPAIVARFLVPYSENWREMSRRFIGGDVAGKSSQDASFSVAGSEMPNLTPDQVSRSSDGIRTKLSMYKMIFGDLMLELKMRSIEIPLDVYL